MTGIQLNREEAPADSIVIGAQTTRGWQSFIANPIVRVWLAGLALSAVFIFYLAVVQFSTEHLTGVDGHYHIRFASMMRSEGLKPDFPWLPLTILNPREFYDHHFLYHVALIPFTGNNLIFGAKLSAIIFPALAFLMIWWLLRNQNVPYSALWALGLLAISEAFIYRMSLVRAQSLSLAVMALGLHWMLTQKYARLLPLGFIYVWLYNAFPMLLVFSGIYAGSVWLIERRLELRPLIFTALGIAIGLIVNPYFPDDIIFVFRHLLPKLTETTAVDVGSEWYPYRTDQLLENSPLSLAIVLAGVLALGLQSRRIDLHTTTAFFIMATFTLMLFQSRRFIEYFPPFALIFTAFAWAPLLSDEKNSIREQGDLQINNPVHPFSVGSGWRKLLPIGIILVVLVPGILFTMQAARKSVGDSRPSTLFAGASNWLAENTPEGSRVFQTDWDDFPRLFFYNTHNTYLIGLDPTYMQLYDSELYDLWVDITQGDVELPSEVIYSRFGARYVVTDLSHRDFINQAEDDPDLQEMYRDGDAIVYMLTSH